MEGRLLSDVCYNQNRPHYPGASLFFAWDLGVDDGNHFNHQR